MSINSTICCFYDMFFEQARFFRVKRSHPSGRRKRSASGVEWRMSRCSFFIYSFEI
jgi:hypothetical protein